jgi:hypothetical protein
MCSLDAPGRQWAEAKMAKTTRGLLITVALVGAAFLVIDFVATGLELYETKFSQAAKL